MYATLLHLAIALDVGMYEALSEEQSHAQQEYADCNYSEDYGESMKHFIYL